MSVEDLDAHIDQFSPESRSAERCAKTAGKQQKWCPAAAQRHSRFNGAVALEISSEICLQWLPETAIPDRVALMLLVNVCKAWSDIALSTQALWAIMEFSAVDVLNVWLQRIRDYPLSISMRRGLDPSVASILGQYAGLLKHLETYEKSLTILKSLWSFSCLETLTIETVSDPRGPIHRSSLAQIIEFLHLTPNLMQFIFHQVYVVDDYRSAEKLVLPNLRRMIIGKLSPELRDISEDDLISHISLPSLDAFALLFDTISNENFRHF
ncbi:hypothetical protein B0H19DRAFT_1277011 [Mycena capillaripes]|nr:hypothetical protein B0H19DRAFT_1277011 [Mycena capillaripes]